MSSGAWQACAAGLEQLRTLTVASDSIRVVASVGTHLVGKSTLLSRLLGQPQLFASNRSVDSTATTSLSVWASVSTVSSSALPPAASSSRTSTVLVALDAQGFRADKDDETEMKLLAILSVACDVLLWSVNARLEASDVAKMGGLRQHARQTTCRCREFYFWFATNNLSIPVIHRNILQSASLHMRSRRRIPPSSDKRERARGA
jgi:hypothetical protein